LGNPIRAFIHSLFYSAAFFPNFCFTVPTLTKNYHVDVT